MTIKSVATIAAIVVVAVAVVIYFVASSGKSNGTGDSNLIIGAITPLTGPFAAYGEPVRDGMLLALEEINAKGGIDGRKLELLIEDDGGDPKNAVTAFTKLASVNKVPIVIGPLSSGASMATAPLADRYKTVQLSTLAGTIDLTGAGDFVFRIYPSSEVGSRYIAGVARDKFGAKRVAVLYPNNSFGVTSNKFVTDVLEASGVEIVAAESYNDGDTDFRTQLTKIAAASPEVLMCSAYYEEGAQILVQARQLGLRVPVLGEDGWFGPIAGVAGDALGDLYFANVEFGPEVKDNQAMKEFVAAYEARFSRPANSFAAAGHAAVHAAAAALAKAPADGAGIRDALYTLELETSFGRLKYDSNGDNIGAVYALYQLDQQNRPVAAK